MITGQQNCQTVGANTLNDPILLKHDNSFFIHCEQ